MAVASLLVLAIGVDTAFARNLDADDRTSAWKGSVGFELKDTTLRKDRRRTQSIAPIWRVWRGESVRSTCERRRRGP